jgi:hypothetical protein
METLRHCRADLVAFVDADCASLPNEMLRLAETATRFDGAIASRRHPASLPGETYASSTIDERRIRVWSQEDLRPALFGYAIVGRRC